MGETGIRKLVRGVQWVFGADVRSLALMRIAMALLMLIDLAVRWGEREIFLTARGLWPLEAAVRFQEPNTFSLFLLSDVTWWTDALLAVYMVACICLLIGCNTQWSAFVCWILLCSLHTRNPMVLNGGDSLLRIMLFWSIFVPLGDALSADAVCLYIQRGGVKMQLDEEVGNAESLWGDGTTESDMGHDESDGEQREGKYHMHRQGASCSCMRECSVGTMCFCLQLAFMYWFTAGLKTGPMWRSDFTASYYALSLDGFASTLAVFSRTHMPLWMMKMGTIAVLAFEVIGPFLMFFPLACAHDILRIVGVLGFWSMHMAFGSNLNIGLFQWIPCAMFLGLIPGSLWDMVFGAASAHRGCQCLCCGVTSHRREQCKQGVTSREKGALAAHRWCQPNVRVVVEWPSVLEEASPQQVMLLAVTYVMLLPRTIVCRATHEQAREMRAQNSILSTLEGEHAQNGAMGVEALMTLFRASPLLFFVPRVVNLSQYLRATVYPLLERAVAPEVTVVTASSGALAIQSRRSGRLALLFALWSYVLSCIQVLCAAILRVVVSASSVSHGVSGKKGHRPVRRWRLSSIVVRSVLVFLIIFVAVWNVASHIESPNLVPHRARWIAGALRLDQWWGMFAPDVPLLDGWFVVHGVFGDGSRMDLWVGGDPEEHEQRAPSLISAQFRNQRWRKYMMNLADPEHEEKRIYFGRYLCKRWNGRKYNEGDMDALERVELVIMQKTTPPPNTEPQDPERVLLLNHSCF